MGLIRHRHCPLYIRVLWNTQRHVHTQVNWCPSFQQTCQNPFTLHLWTHATHNCTLEPQDPQDHIRPLGRQFWSEILLQGVCQLYYQRVIGTLQYHHQLGSHYLLRPITKMELQRGMSRYINAWICNPRTNQVQPPCPGQITTCSSCMGRTSLKPTTTTSPDQSILCSFTWQRRHSPCKGHRWELPGNYPYFQQIW